ETVAARDEGLETLAGVTNAGGVIRMAATDSPLARVARETSAQYVATFDPEANERTDQMSRVELRVAREGVGVRTFGEISMAPVAAAPAAGGANLVAMLKSPGAYPALPLRAMAFY